MWNRYSRDSNPRDLSCTHTHNLLVVVVAEEEKEEEEEEEEEQEEEEEAKETHPETK